MIYVISQIKFITELNPQFIKIGFFVVKNVGMKFPNKIIIPTVAQESQDYKFTENKLAKSSRLLDAWKSIKLC